ncbi:unnamed protein product, partial [Arabidopsis halleri]
MKLLGRILCLRILMLVELCFFVFLSSSVYCSVLGFFITLIKYIR